MTHIKEGFVGAVPFSDNRPNYYDNPKKYTHKWVGKEVVIDFGSDSNIHPRRQRVSIKSVEPDRIVFITRNNADIIVNDRDYDEWKNIKAQITAQLVEEVTNMSNKKRLTEAESYGWVVEDWDAQEAYEFACDAFGEEELNRQIVMAIGNEELASCLAYIFRMNDFREWEEYKNGEELDEGCSKKKSKKKIKESVDGDLKSAVYNALSDVCFEFMNKGNHPTEEEMDIAIEWWQTHYWDDDYFDENESVSAKNNTKRINESASDAKTIWSSSATRDYYYDAPIDELRQEIYEEGNISDEEVAEMDENEIRDYFLDDPWYWDEADEEDLKNNIIPEIENQCSNGLWLAGDYQRWDGAHAAMFYSEDVENGVIEVCYPGYDATTELVRDMDGRVYFTEYSHDAPMGGTAMYLYTITDLDKSLEIADEIYPEDDWEHELYEVAEDAKWIKACIDRGVMVPVKL